jgi:hypothetical protein
MSFAGANDAQPRERCRRLGRLLLDGVGLAPSWQRPRDVGPVDPFGFSWPQAVSLRTPTLMSVGFPWISLDSLVRIETFQWVTRLEAGKLFSQPFSLAFDTHNGRL